MLEIAIGNTDRLVRLINDILDLERMASGHVEVWRRVATPDPVMQATDSSRWRSGLGRAEAEHCRSRRLRPHSPDSNQPPWQ
jgi:hypothetical protein